MSSAGQAIGGVFGAVVGFFIGGPSGALYGAQIGMMAGGYLDPPKGPDIKGPRLDDLSVQTSTYGAVIPRIYGTVALFGNVFWLENNKLKEVATETETDAGGKGGGGSSQTTTTYAYYATFAVGLCDCTSAPITGIRRIWLGGKLFYDAGSGDIGAIQATAELGKYITLYTGSDSQQPDPRMQAALGINNTPAYRGLAYLVFKDYPLAEHGNSLVGMQVKVEVVALGTVQGLTRTTTVPDCGVYFSDNYGAHAGQPYIQSVSGGVVKVAVAGTLTQYLFTTAGVLIGTEEISDMPISGQAFDGYQYITSAGLLDGHELWVRAEYGSITKLQPCLMLGRWNAEYDLLSHALPQNRDIVSTIIANDGQSVIVILANPGESIGVAFVRTWYELNSAGEILRTGLTEPISCNYFSYSRSAQNHFASTSYDQDSGWIATAYGAGTGSVYTCRIDADNVIREKERLGYGLSYYNFTAPSCYCQDGVIFVFTGKHFNIFSRGKLTDAPPTLGDIVRAECLGSRLLTAGDLDVSALTQPVRGYRLSDVAAIRGAIDPLRGAWPFDLVQAGYAIRCMPRGGSSVVTIPGSDLDAHAVADSSGVAISNAREMDSVLPKRVAINFLDFDREFDVGVQYDERLNTESANIHTLDLAIVLSNEEAAGIAQRLLYLYWMERYDLTFCLPPTYTALEPGDIVTVNADNAIYSLRLTAITYTQDGRLECSAKYSNPAVYQPSAVGETPENIPPGLAVRSATRYELLDLPCLNDSYDKPVLGLQMSGYLPGWPGGVLLRSEDVGATWEAVAYGNAPGPIHGFALNVVGAGQYNLIDGSLVVSVRLWKGELASVSELALLNGANHFAYGLPGRWEIIGAKNCVLQGDGSYLLSDLLRGRAGTEWASGLHVVGDHLIALNAAVGVVGCNLNSIGLPRLYKAVTAGDKPENSPEDSFTYTGVNLECLSPVYLNGNRHPTTNDWTLTWIRRTRVGGSWRNYVDASLGEATEAYEIEIYSSAAYATVKRTLSSTSASVAYTGAQQVSDFGSNQTTLYLKVYQLSATVGRGYPLITSITR